MFLNGNLSKMLFSDHGQRIHLSRKLTELYANNKKTTQMNLFIKSNTNPGRIGLFFEIPVILKIKSKF